MSCRRHNRRVSVARLGLIDGEMPDGLRADLPRRLDERRKAMRFAWLVALAMGLNVYPHAVSATEGTEKIAAYIGVAEKMRYQSEQVADRLAQSNARAAAALSRALGVMQLDELNARAATVLDNHLTEADVQRLLDFMETPLGQRYGLLTRTARSPAALREALASWSPEDINNPIFSSPAMTNLMGALNSQEWRDTWKTYGEALMCKALQTDDPQGYENVRKLGRCTVAEQGGPNPAVRRSDPNR